MNGLFLQGGGAKGAFQAGVLAALYENGYEFNIISGTSIGAINAYFLFRNSLEEMKHMWINMSNNNSNSNMNDTRVVDNSKLINRLTTLNGKDTRIKSVYVNYVSVENSTLREVVADITKLDEDEGLNAVKYSSLLPIHLEGDMTMGEIIRSFNSKEVFNNFKEDLVKGAYDGYNLDGGILNNNFVSPFLKHKVDKLFLIPLSNKYEVPTYIMNYYDMKDIVLIKPESSFEPRATLMFNRDFCSRAYEEGYNLAKRTLSI